MAGDLEEMLKLKRLDEAVWNTVSELNCEYKSPMWWWAIQGIVQEAIANRGWWAEIEIFPDGATASVWIDEDVNPLEMDGPLPSYALLSAFVAAIEVDLEACKCI